LGEKEFEGRLSKVVFRIDRDCDWLETVG
jgi:hypothetical protein